MGSCNKGCRGVCGLDRCGPESGRFPSALHPAKRQRLPSPEDRVPPHRVDAPQARRHVLGGSQRRLAVTMEACRRDHCLMRLGGLIAAALEAWGQLRLGLLRGRKNYIRNPLFAQNNCCAIFLLPIGSFTRRLCNHLNSLRKFAFNNT